MEAKRPVFAFLKALPRKYLQKESLIFGDLNTGCRQSEVNLLPEGNEFYDAVTGGPIGAEPKIEGQWVYLYRAADKAGRTVDFRLSRRRDIAAAKRFFSRATKQNGAPRAITLDGYAASHRAVAKLKTSGILPLRVQVRSFLNNVVEQDHRRIKQRIGADARIQAIRDGGRDDSGHSS